MDRENDNSSEGGDRSGVPPTGSALRPVQPEPVASAAASLEGGAATADDQLHSGRASDDGRVMHEIQHPVPLVPAGYLPSEGSVLRPSVAATLPPLQLTTIERAPARERIEPQFAPAIDASRLTLAPEAHAQRSHVVDAAGWPNAAEPVLVVASGGAPVAPTSILQDVDAPLPAVSSPFWPSQALPSQLSATPVAPLDDASSIVAPLRIDADRRPQPIARENLTSEAIAHLASPPPAKKSIADYIKLGLKYAVFAAAAWLALIAILLFAYRVVDPPMSSLMLQQRLTGQDVRQTWVPMEDISHQIVRAVLLSEDGRFCDHTGVDFDAMQDAIERAGDGAPRGASTISMQVIKNLFLWPSKSYVRKAIEIPLTWAMELVWPKRRIMEIYLNIAEWGPGIFGVEAASQFHFQKSAKRLNEREAAQLAVALPNPYMRDAGDPGPKTRRLASDIQARMRNSSTSQTACVLTAARAAR